MKNSTLKLSTILLMFSVFAISLASCQPEPKTDDGKIATKADAGPIHIEAKSWSLLTADLWHYDAAIKVSDESIGNPYKGHWIDFEDDLSYTRGVWGKQTGQGVWNFDNDSKILQINPSKGEETDSEWKIQTNGDVIILVGTATFKNNAEQIKISRHKDLPIEE